MSSIGPQLPPHLAKRKRTPEDDGSDGLNSPSPPSKQARHRSAPKIDDEIGLDDSSSADEDGFGPSAPAVSKPVIGASLPPKNNDQLDLASDSEPDIGPNPTGSGTQEPPDPGPSARPPADDSTSSDSEDDYGPALPGTDNASKPAIGPSMPPSEPAPQRDSWMLAPPSSSAYTERDPTRIRARKFASKPTPSGRGGTTNTGGVSSIWTETPEEKLQRLQDSVLGRKPDAGDGAQGGRGDARAKEQEERDRKIAANVEAQRGGSLYNEHQKLRREGDGRKDGTEEEEEDDPSKRGFDREKDMALGGKIGTAQRRELMNKAANFGGRFQKGSYL